MLWTLILAVGAIAAVSASVGAARHAHVGIVGYGTAILIGAAVAAASVWTLNRVGRTCYERFKNYPERQAERLFRAMYLAAFLWSFVAAGLALLLVSAALRRIQ